MHHGEAAVPELLRLLDGEDSFLAMEAMRTVTITLQHESQWAGGNLGRFRFFVTTGDNELTKTGKARP